MRELGLCLILLVAGCASYRDADVPLTVAKDFAPAQYLGRWYEIASFPTPFQRGCTKTQAVYSATATPGQIGVVNTCEKSDGTTRIAGRVEIIAPAKLRVRLDGVPVAAPYWVLWVDDAYQTAVVGVPSGRAGWILSKTPNPSAAKLAKARSVLARNGYDLAQLQATPQ